MSKDIVQGSEPQSPFDSIRHFDEHGNEFWNARELMKMLGYAKWDKFDSGTIAQACENLKLAGEQVSAHAFPVRGTYRGQEKADYKLSRLGCYHVVLACQGKGKPNVALAKQYFAVKTREAEIKVPALEQELELQRLRNEELSLQLQVQQSQLALGQFRHNVVTMLPEPAQQKILGYQEVRVIEEREVHITPEGDRSEGFGITAIAKRYGFKSTKKAWQWLEAIGLGKDAPQWSSETRGVTSKVLPPDYIADLDAAWVEGDGRDRFLGE